MKVKEAIFSLVICLNQLIIQDLKILLKNHLELRKLVRDIMIYGKSFGKVLGTMKLAQLASVQDFPTTLKHFTSTSKDLSDTPNLLLVH